MAADRYVISSKRHDEEHGQPTDRQTDRDARTDMGSEQTDETRVRRMTVVHWCSGVPIVPNARRNNGGEGKGTVRDRVCRQLFDRCRFILYTGIGHTVIAEEERASEWWIRGSSSFLYIM